MERLVRCLEIVTLVSVAACASGGRPVVRAEAQRVVDSLFAPYTGTSVPGASVVVLKDGQDVVRRAYGMADLERRVAATPETNYRLASLTKGFTALSIALLEGDGKLRVNQRIREILPELPPLTRDVTIQHLLDHKSGLVDYEDLIPQGRTAQLTDRDVLDLIASSSTSYFAPGSSYRYSNSGYVLLGIIIARVSGMPLPDFLRTRIFIPAGMKSTVMHVEGVDTVLNRAYGYSPRGGEFVKTDQSVTSATLGDGGIYSNVDDLIGWDKTLYGITVVDPAALLNDPMGPVSAGVTGTQYLFGWFIDTYRGRQRWRHTGETSGFHNAIMRFPDRRFTVIVLTNRSSGAPDAIAERIADRLLFR